MKTAEDFPAPSCEVWDECWESFKYLVRVQNQWRSGASGPYALDYNVLYKEFEIDAVPPARIREIMDDIRIMEPVALKEILTPP